MTKMTNVSAWIKILMAAALVATILLGLGSKKNGTVGLKGSRRLQNPPNFVDLSGGQQPPPLPDLAPLRGNLVPPPGIINSSVEIPQPGNFVNSSPQFQNSQESNGPQIPNFAPIPTGTDSFPGNNFEDFPTISTSGNNFEDLPTIPMSGNFMNSNDFIQNQALNINPMNERIDRAPAVMFNSPAPAMFSTQGFNNPSVGNLISGINSTSSLITSTIGISGNSDSINNLINGVNASFTTITGSGQRFQQFPTSP